MEKKFEIKWQDANGEPQSAMFVEADDHTQAEVLAREKVKEQGGIFKSMVEIVRR